MKLLFVSHSFPPHGRPELNLGGMQRVAQELFAALGHVPGLRLESELLLTSWTWTHARIPAFLTRVARRLFAEARSEPGVVVFSSMVTATMALVAGKTLRRAGWKTAVIVHGLDITTPFAPYQAIVRKVLSRVDFVLPVSRATGEASVARGADPAKVVVVPNGIDVSRFAPPSSRRQARVELLQSLGLSLPDDAFLLCSVGRHVRRKGFAWAAEHLIPHVDSRVHWLLAGEGPETDAVVQAAEKAKVADRVHVLGRTSDAQLRLLYQGCDLFLMPNRPVPNDMEGFGVVMLEAGLAGLPSLAAALEGILDVIHEGENGHLVPSGDVSAFAAHIHAYLNNPDALAALSARTATFVPARFSWDAVAQRLVQVTFGNG